MPPNSANTTKPTFVRSAASAPGIRIGVIALLSQTEDHPLPADTAVILVAEDFSPTDVLAMEEQRVKGFITAQGGPTCLPLIVARNRGLPALVGLADKLTHLKHGDQVILDGNNGGVWLFPSPEQLRQVTESQLTPPASDQGHLPTETKDGHRLDILANLDLADEAAHALALGAQGIGLFRSEGYYASGLSGPDEELLTAIYQHLLTTFSPMPVTIRLLDFGSQGHSPMGRRGSRLHPRDQPLIKTQLRALIKAAPHGNLRLLLPMLSTLQEILTIKDMLSKLQQETTPAQPRQSTEIALGLLLEIPNATAMLKQFSAELDFLTIGSNDLLQFNSGAARDIPELTNLHDPLNPATLDMLAHTVTVGHDQGLEVGISGEMAGEIRYLPLLIGLGFDNFSVTPHNIPQLKKTLRATTYDRAVNLANKVRHNEVQQRHRIIDDFLQTQYR